MAMDGDLMSVTRTEIEIQKDRMVRVILKNDDSTPMDFVVLVMAHVFQKGEVEAITLMLTAHKSGRALIDVMPKKLARAKRVEAMRLANQFGFTDFTIDLEEDG